MCNYLIANIYATFWLRNGFGNFFSAPSPKRAHPSVLRNPGVNKFHLPWGFRNTFLKEKLNGGTQG